LPRGLVAADLFAELRCRVGDGEGQAEQDGEDSGHVVRIISAATVIVERNRRGIRMLSSTAVVAMRAMTKSFSRIVRMVGVSPDIGRFAISLSRDSANSLRCPVEGCWRRGVWSARRAGRRPLLRDAEEVIAAADEELAVGDGG
jgi:hypothetical protein